MTFFSQAHRTCGTTHFICLCTILHATGFGLPPNFEDCVREAERIKTANFKQIDMYLQYTNVQCVYK